MMRERSDIQGEIQPLISPKSRYRDTRMQRVRHDHVFMGSIMKDKSTFGLKRRKGL
jgi:hypothetical protein